MDQPPPPPTPPPHGGGNGNATPPNGGQQRKSTTTTTDTTTGGGSSSSSNGESSGGAYYPPRTPMASGTSSSSYHHASAAATTTTTPAAAAATANTTTPYSVTSTPRGVVGGGYGGVGSISTTPSSYYPTHNTPTNAAAAAASSPYYHTPMNASSSAVAGYGTPTPSTSTTTAAATGGGGTTNYYYQNLPAATTTPIRNSSSSSSPAMSSYMSPTGPVSSSSGGYASPTSTSTSASLKQRQRRSNFTFENTPTTPISSYSQRQEQYESTYGNLNNSPTTRHGQKTTMKRKLVKTLDMFPKVESDLMVKTEGGGIVSLLGYLCMAILVMAELLAYGTTGGGLGGGLDHKEHLVVDTALGKKMQINFNITFPSLACEDVHVDVMDVAGDSQLNLEETIVKHRLHGDGRIMDVAAMLDEANKSAQRDEERKRIQKESMDPNYCGPCYGAEDMVEKPPPTNGTTKSSSGGDKRKCCNTCDELREAYKKKRWGTEGLMMVAEQCIREGREAIEIKRMKKGEGCNIGGYLEVNRVAGNFHIAMGEGVERDGRHIHQFVPDDAPNFNASHIIHELSFGPPLPGTKKKKKKDHRSGGGSGSGSLDGVKKIVQPEHGTTGLFQYFLKVVPTIYKDGSSSSSTSGRGRSIADGNKAAEAEEKNNKVLMETNRYFFTERFRPLLKELDEEHVELGSETQPEVHGAAAGGKIGTHHDHHEHHRQQNAVLPGVFFMYEIYPFAVEVSRTSVPLTHLIIRLMAVIGGVMTVTGLIDAMFYARQKSGGGGSRSRSSGR